MSKRVKCLVILGLILYPAFVFFFVGTLLWILFTNGVIENEAIYNFLSTINQTIDPSQWPAWATFLFGILLLFVLAVLIAAELSLHLVMLKVTKKWADDQRDANLNNTTSSYSSPSISIDSSGTGHISGGFAYDRPILNLPRIFQILVCILLIVLIPVIYPFDAIIHLIIYR